MFKTKKILPYVFALEHYLLAIVFSLNNFEYDKAFKDHLTEFIVSQVFLVCTLVLIYNFVFKVFSNKERYKDNIKMFFIYFIINIILLIIIWPRNMET